MIVAFLLVVFVVFSYIRPLLLEMERRDALILNATLRQAEKREREGGRRYD